MTDSKLRSLVAEAVELDRDIRTQTERLKQLKNTLTLVAETRADESIATDGGGTSITFLGDNDCIARVTTAGGTLKSAIKSEGKDIEKVRSLAGRFFDRLFLPIIAYKPVENFRDEAAGLLGADGRKLIKACETPGKTTVNFETVTRN